MDELVQPLKAAGPADQEPCLPAFPEVDLPADFFSLRLLLESTGATLELTKPEVLVGRHSECDVRLPLPDVSRRHCLFLFRDGAWHVRDLKSLNGVHVNGIPIDDDTMVAAGDKVRIAGFHFQLESATEPIAPTEDVPQTILYRIFRALPRLDNQAARRKAG